MLKFVSMNILIYANCQANAIGSLLQCCDFFRDNCRFVKIPPVHRITKAFIDESLKTKAQGVSLLLSQPIRADYRGGGFSVRDVMQHLPDGTVGLSFASIQFYGYMPTAKTLKGLNLADRELHSKHLGMPVGDCYHHAVVARSYLAGDAAAVAFEKFEDEFVGEEERLRRLAEDSLHRLIHAEEEHAVDLPVGLHVKQGFRQRQLFHSPRHPVTEILLPIVRAAIERLGGVVSDADVARMQRKEPLRLPYYPLQRSVAQALGMNHEDFDVFEARDLKVNKREWVERCLAFYAEASPSVAQQAASV